MSNTNPANSGPARSLPERANLEHLRKEAKQRLKSMRLDDPDATLAAAQLATARQYGFTSWRRLVAQVTALYEGEFLLSTCKSIPAFNLHYYTLEQVVLKSMHPLLSENSSDLDISLKDLQSVHSFSMEKIVYGKERLVKRLRALRFE